MSRSMTRSARLGVMAALILTASSGALAQWKPTGALASVLVVRDCRETGGDVAVSRLDPPTIYLCPHVAALIRKTHPGAENFYYVHEFGHVALQTSDEAAADCWAAHELAQTRQGRHDIAQVIALLQQRADEASPRYGTPGARAARIRDCAGG